MTWRCTCCQMASHMLHDVTIVAMASPIFVRSVRYSSITGKDNFRDVYKKSILKLSLPEQMAPGFVKFKMGAETGVVFPTAFLANEDVVCFVDFHHLPYMASLTTRYCFCTTCKMTKPCEWTSLVLVPPAGGQVMGLCENNWYPALQIILEPDWINITNWMLRNFLIGQ